MKLLGGREGVRAKYFTKFENFLISQSREGYLLDIGWDKCLETGKPVDKHGNPIPWVTYSFIDFISGRMTKGLQMLEYGCGNSTIFYAKQGCDVTAVEHVQEWLDIVRPQLPANAQVLHVDLVPGGDYAQTAKRLGKAWDIIIVDGRDRVNCTIHSSDYLSEGGVLILDDSERERYKPAYTHMAAKGYRHIDFWGISPGLFYRKSTTVFYKPGNNVLGI